MKHRYFPESLRFLYGICAKASLLQKLGAVKDWLEFLSSPELGSSEFRYNIEVWDYYQ